MNSYIDMSYNGTIYSFSMADSEYGKGVYVHYYTKDGGGESRFYFNQSKLPNPEDLGWWLTENSFISDSMGVEGLASVRLLPGNETPVYLKTVVSVALDEIKITAPVEDLIVLGRTIVDSGVQGDWLDIAYIILREYDDEWNDREAFDVSDDSISIRKK